MAKEWDKFQADYKKIKPAYMACKSSEMKVMQEGIVKLNTLITEGAEIAEEAWLDAIKSGVNGNRPEDFMGYAPFSAAVKGVQKLCTSLQTSLAKFDAAGSEAVKVQADLKKLSDAIVKDLKSRKDSSATKKDIEALQKTCEQEAKDLALSIAIQKKLKPVYAMTANDPMMVIRDVLKGSTKEAEDARKRRDLPHHMTDKILKGNLNKVVLTHKRIVAACKDMTEGKDPAKALKAAQADIVAIQKIVDLYERAVKDGKQDLDNASNKAEIVKSIDTINKAYKSAGAKFKDAVAAMKAVKKAS